MTLIINTIKASCNLNILKIQTLNLYVKIGDLIKFNKKKESIMNIYVK